MRHIELVEKSISNRGNIIPLEQLERKTRKHEAYITMFPFGDEINQHLKIKKSVKGYSGIQFCEAILIDIDSEGNLQAAHDSVVELIDRLNGYGVNMECVEISFSGNKGYHVALPPEVVGKIEPQRNIHEVVKEFVRRLTEGIEHVDMSIYDPVRLIRLKNSINKKSGLYKIQVSFDEFILGGVDGVLNLAKHPRGGTSIKREQNNELTAIFNQCTLPKIEIKEAANDLFFSPPEKGNRNNKLFKQACMLFDVGLGVSHVKEIIKSINRAGDPIEDTEILNIVSSAISKTNFKSDSPQAYTLAELEDEYLEYLAPEKNAMTLLDEDFDRSIHKKTRGKMIPILGYPGTKKSLFALNIAAQNMPNGARCLYSNMEMGAGELINRSFDVRYKDDVMISEYLQRKAHEDIKIVKKHYRELVKDFGNRFYITQNSQMIVEKYDQLLKELEQKSGKFDILVVDGLSMMGGNFDSEVKKINEHTRLLKVLALEHTIMVLPIVHLSKGKNEHDRNILQNARDSQKIIDNGDYFFQLSRCVDNALTTKNNIEYYNDLMYIRFWAKRGTGATINKIFEFEKNTLNMKSNGHDPKVYDLVKTQTENFLQI